MIPRPTAPKHPTGARPSVAVGPVTPLGLPADQMAATRSGADGLVPAIMAALMLAHTPDAKAAPVLAQSNRMTAPSAGATTLNVALSNLLAPLSSTMAAAGTDGALERRGMAPDADLSAESGRYGTAASLGAALGGLTMARGVPTDGVPLPQRATAPVESTADQVRREFFEKLSPAEQKYVLNDPTVKPIFASALKGTVPDKTTQLAAALLPALSRHAPHAHR